MKDKVVESALIVAFIVHAILVVSFAQDNAGPCTCDLTQFACDPNCCCDSDCNATDIGAFSYCSNDYSFSSVQSCFPSAIMFRNYTPYSVNTTSASGFSCIYHDRFTARTYYNSPQVENNNVTKLALKAESYAGFNFSSTTSPTDYSAYGSAYKAGDPVHIVYQANNNTGRLRQPGAANSPLCGYSAPALFMHSAASSCARAVTAATCATDGAIQLAVFVQGFRVVPQPGLFASNSTDALNYTSLTPIVQGSMVCRNRTGGDVNCTGTVPSPALDGSYCSFVLTKLTYNIKYHAINGIYEVSYNAELGEYNVGTTGGYLLRQTFTTAYNLSQSSSSAAQARSGNPGYITGKPVMAGTRNTTTNSVQINADPALWLTVPGADAASGACSSAVKAARSVTFGESLQSGCWRQLSWTPGTDGGLASAACASLSANVRASLASLGIGGEIVVASYGNTADTSLTGWVSVHVDNATCGEGLEQQTTVGCTNLLLGGRLDLLVARTGSVASPQNSIVAARLQCSRGNVTVQCTAGACSTGSGAAISQRFLTSYAVNFVDASSTPTSSLTAPTSIFQQRLVRDFFYLLYVENGAAVGSASSAAVIGCWMVGLAIAHWLAN